MTQFKKHAIHQYWSTHPIIATPQFSKFMRRDRYMEILKNLHFNDNETATGKDYNHKIEPILSKLNLQFKSSLVPFKNLCIDESLVKFKGRLGIKQYIPNKRSRFGIKLFLLCDCETGYVLKLLVYTGSQTQLRENSPSDIGKSGQIVYTLMQEYLSKGHTLYVDDWYTSPLPFKHLLDNGTNACGTVKANRKFLPRDGKQRKVMGSLADRCTKNMLYINWMDKKQVNMLTTAHKPGMIPNLKNENQRLLPRMFHFV